MPVLLRGVTRRTVLMCSTLLVFLGLGWSMASTTAGRRFPSRPRRQFPFARNREFAVSRPGTAASTLESRIMARTGLIKKGGLDGGVQAHVCPSINSLHICAVQPQHAEPGCARCGGSCVGQRGSTCVPPVALGDADALPNPPPEKCLPGECPSENERQGGCWSARPLCLAGPRAAAGRRCWQRSVGRGALGSGRSSLARACAFSQPCTLSHRWPLPLQPLVSLSSSRVIRVASGSPADGRAGRLGDGGRRDRSARGLGRSGQLASDRNQTFGAFRWLWSRGRSLESDDEYL